MEGKGSDPRGATSAHSALVINRTSSIAAVEDFLEQLVDAPSDRDLLLPNALRARQLGGTSAMLQLIATWHRRCPGGRIRTHVSAGGPHEDRRATVERFIKADHGFFGWALTRGQLLNRTGDEDLDDIAAPLGSARLATMDAVASAKRGQKVLLTAVGDGPHAEPRVFYKPRDGGEPEVRESAGFRNLARELRDAITLGREARLARTERHNVGLARLLRELFRNTHDWARRDASGVTYRSGVRGVRVELHNIDIGQVSTVTTDPALAEFVARGPSRGRDRLHLVELSVFDCGPGLAAHRLCEVGADPADMDAEVAAVRHCLGKHFSSSHEPVRGVGLHRVLGTISELNGLLRIRTGRLHLYRDFSDLPYEPRRNRDEPYLVDWKSRLAATQAAPVSGTFYTLLFPLPRVRA